MRDRRTAIRTAIAEAFLRRIVCEKGYAAGSFRSHKGYYGASLEKFRIGPYDLKAYGNY